jgi:hypothetical protein
MNIFFWRSNRKRDKDEFQRALTENVRLRNGIHTLIILLEAEEEEPRLQPSALIDVITMKLRQLLR